MLSYKNTLLSLFFFSWNLLVYYICLWIIELIISWWNYRIEMEILSLLLQLLLLKQNLKKNQTKLAKKPSLIVSPKKRVSNKFGLELTFLLCVMITSSCNTNGGLIRKDVRSKLTQCCWWIYLHNQSFSWETCLLVSDTWEPIFKSVF